METTYAMIGSDGQQYGPATLAQIKTWINEGRIGSQTQVWRSDTNTWLAASQYVELGLAPSPPPPLQGRAAAGGNLLLLMHVRRGSRWFYWIAALSLINAFMGISGQAVMFLTGLAVTKYYFDFTSDLGSNGQAFALALCVLTAGLFALFGFFAGKRHSWSFVVGMVLYGLDALLFLPHQFWLGIAFHVFILFRLFRGFQACNQLAAQPESGQA